MPGTPHRRVAMPSIGAVVAFVLLALTGPAAAQTGGNPVLRNPSQMEPRPNSMAPDPNPAPARPMPQPPRASPNGQPPATLSLPNCTPPGCGTPSIMAPPVQ